MQIILPELSLVMLVGVSGSGKSSFAKRHFRSTEILSSDFFRGMISDDENNQVVNGSAFELLHFACAKRLETGRLTVIDATNVQTDSRKVFHDFAKRYHVPAYAIVLALDESLCGDRSENRLDRVVPRHVIRTQSQQLQQARATIRKERFTSIFELTTPEMVEAATITRERLPVNRRDEAGPFDIIGDVHGCFDELCELLLLLGWCFSPTGDAIPPTDRKVVFVGDLVDRGPKTPEVLRLVMKMVANGHAMVVQGNHDDKLLRSLQGHDVSVTHGLKQSLDQLANETPEFRQQSLTFLEGLQSHLVLAQGELVVAHAGMKKHYHGRVSKKIRVFGLYGETTGETDELGYPIRLDWAANYSGQAAVVYGHTVTPKPEWINNTICIDTGCVFGGSLTALRYPERELISVPAKERYAEGMAPTTGQRYPIAVSSDD